MARSSVVFILILIRVRCVFTLGIEMLYYHSSSRFRTVDPIFDCLPIIFKMIRNMIEPCIPGEKSRFWVRTEATLPWAFIRNFETTELLKLRGRQRWML